MTSTQYPVMPMHEDTFIGIPTDKNAKGFSILVANADGVVTFKYGAIPKAQPAVKGQAFEIRKSCTEITSTISVTMS